MCQSVERRWLRIVVQRSSGSFADVDVTVNVTSASSSSSGQESVFFWEGWTLKVSVIFCVQ